MPVAVAFSALLQVTGVVLPPLRDLLGTAPLTTVDLLGCAAAGLLPGLVLRLARRSGTLGRGAGTKGPVPGTEASDRYAAGRTG